MNGPYSGIKYALINHPNIELKFYEPLNLFKPWTLQNRLHDKYIIMDKELVLMGGRNIGDGYYIDDYDGARVYDRDIIIINGDKDNFNNSVVKDIVAYYNLLWEYEFSLLSREKVKFPAEKNLGSKKEAYLRGQLAEFRDKNPAMFTQTIDWRSRAVSTNKITLISNSISRLNKDPRILREAGRIIGDAESVFILSPYIIPTKQMLKYIDLRTSGY